jgi:hypothetical protein
LAPTWLILVPRWAPRGTFFIPFSEIFGGIAPNPQKAIQIVRKCSENCPEWSEHGAKMLRNLVQNGFSIGPTIKFRASRSNAKQVYVGTPFRFFFVYVGSCWGSWAPCWLMLALLGPILSPSCSKMPKMAPR